MSPPMSPWIKNAWYVAALSSELERPIRRTLMGERCVAFRVADGTVAVLEDRCPHKSAPLSMGQVVGNVIECPYHGMQFDTAGRCTRVWGQQLIPERARVRAWPCVERFGLVWFWPGRADLADPDDIETFRTFDAPGWTTFHGPPLLFRSCMMNIIENLVDPAHTSFVHRGTIGGSDAADVPLEIAQESDAIMVGRWIDGAEPVPVMREFANFAGKVDRWQQYRLRLPNVSIVDFGAIDAGSVRTEVNRDAGYRTCSCAVLTPETAHSTHYFWFVSRSFAPGDDAVSEKMRSAYVATFEEDRALLEAIEEIETESGTRPPLRIAIEGAGVKLRRAMEQRLTAETGLAAE